MAILQCLRPAFSACIRFCAETVNYIVQRGEVQSTLGVVAGMVLYMYWPAGRKLGCLSGAESFIGSLAKPPAMMFMPILFTYIYLFESARNEIGSGITDRFLYTFRASLPALATCLAIAILQVVMTPKTFVSGASSAYNYWLTQPSVILHYIKSFFIPTELTADTDRTAVTSIFSETFVISAWLLVMIALAVRPAFQRPQLRPIAFGILWFVLAALPTCLQPLAELDNDHRMFFPYVGLSLAVVWGLFHFVLQYLDHHPPLPVWAGTSFVVAMFAVLAACGWGTYQRNIVWHSEESLWKDVTEKSPHNGRGLMNYGLVKLGAGDYSGALALFQQAEIYTPYYSILKSNEGIAYGALGDDSKAESYFQQAISLAPGDASGYYFFARWLNQKKRQPAAVALLRRAMELNSADVDTRYLLMKIYAEQGDAVNRNALAALANDTLRMFPGDPTAAGFLTNVATGFASAPAAAKQPSTPEDFLNLSLAYEQAGKHEECIAAANQALKMRPDYAEAYNNIAAANQSMGRWDEAIAAAQKAVALRPDFQLARNNLQYSLNEKRLRQGGVMKAP